MIEYIFLIEESDPLHFQINIDRQYSAKADQTNHVFWVILGYCQCENCPLAPQEYRYCPAASDLQEIIDDFSTLISFDKATVVVKTAAREYRKTCDVQTGLQSLLGLVMATSGCPILSKLKPLANFHLPFATTEDTLFRTAGAYLIQQYFIYSDGGEPDFRLKELESFYSNLEKLNGFFSERIRIASETDANLGAVVQLGALSFLVRASLEQQLRDFRASFQGRLF